MWGRQSRGAAMLAQMGDKELVSTLRSLRCSSSRGWGDTLGSKRQKEVTPVLWTGDKKSVSLSPGLVHKHLMALWGSVPAPGGGHTSVQRLQECTWQVSAHSRRNTLCRSCRWPSAKRGGAWDVPAMVSPGGKYFLRSSPSWEL